MLARERGFIDWQFLREHALRGGRAVGKGLSALYQSKLHGFGSRGWLAVAMADNIADYPDRKRNVEPLQHKKQHTVLF
jgi:hypothetical protein